MFRKARIKKIKQRPLNNEFHRYFYGIVIRWYHTSQMKGGMADWRQCQYFSQIFNSWEVPRQIRINTLMNGLHRA